MKDKIRLFAIEIIDGNETEIRFSKFINTSDLDIWKEKLGEDIEVDIDIWFWLLHNRIKMNPLQKAIIEINEEYEFKLKTNQSHSKG